MQCCYICTAQAEVISVDGKRGSKFDLKTQAEADALGRRIAQASLQVQPHTTWLICMDDASVLIAVIKLPTLPTDVVKCTAYLHTNRIITVF